MATTSVAAPECGEKSIISRTPQKFMTDDEERQGRICSMQGFDPCRGTFLECLLLADLAARDHSTHVVLGSTEKRF
jgi:hypothetical protein